MRGSDSFSWMHITSSPSTLALLLRVELVAGSWCVCSTALIAVRSHRRCLEAISQSVHVASRPWTGVALPQQQHGSRPPLPPLSTAAMMASMPSMSLDALPPVGEGNTGNGAQPGSPRKRGRRQAGFATTQPNGD